MLLDVVVPNVVRDIAATKGDSMNDNQQTLDPMKVLADIQALVRVALESADPDVMRRD